MCCVIVDNGEIIGVMITRDIEKEQRWNKESLNKLSTTTGTALYNAKELKGFDWFMEMYGFKLLYDNKGKVVRIVTPEGNDFETGRLFSLNTADYPELIDVMNE